MAEEEGETREAASCRRSAVHARKKAGDTQRKRVPQHSLCPAAQRAECHVCAPQRELGTELAFAEAEGALELDDFQTAAASIS